MRVVADQLPMANRHVLHWRPLRSERNKMTLSNLGLIFCPTLVTYVEIIVPVEHHDCDTNRHRRETASTREALQREKQQVADTATITATHNANETDTNDKNIATAILVDLSYDDSTETNNPVSVSNTTSTFIPSVHSTSPPPLLPPRPKSRTASNTSIDAVVSPSFPSPSPSSVQPSDSSNTTTSTNTKSIPPPLPPRSRRASPPASLTLSSSSSTSPSTTSSGSGSGSEVNSIPSESISSSHQSYPTGLVQIPIDQMYCSRASATADDTDQVDLLSDDLAECGLLNLSPRLGVHPGRVARTRALFEH
ncbi:hypothetical protein BDF22DRAFT_672685 [Syncephalis plumigaleata]|nr:hypothetical protein BDF22DRAFT_672685 [Syncephalis plumigaleata]